MIMRRDLQLLKNRKIETSKKIIIVSYLISIILTLIVIICTFKELDVSDLTQITLASYAEVSTSNIFYYKKAARENILKLKKDLINDVDINNLF